MIILGDSADWPEKHFPGQSAERILNTSGAGSVTARAQELSHS